MVKNLCHKQLARIFLSIRKPIDMPKYSKHAGEKVEKVMHEMKKGTLKSGSGDKVTSRTQAIAIGLSEAREEGAKVPKKTTTKKPAKKSAKKAAPKKAVSKKTAKKAAPKRSAKKAAKTSARKRSA